MCQLRVSQFWGSFQKWGAAVGVKSYSNEATAAYVFRLLFNRWSFFALAGTGAIILDAKDMHGVGSQARAAGGVRRRN